MMAINFGAGRIEEERPPYTAGDILVELGLNGGGGGSAIEVILPDGSAYAIVGADINRDNPKAPVVQFQTSQLRGPGGEELPEEEPEDLLALLDQM